MQTEIGDCPNEVALVRLSVRVPDARAISAEELLAPEPTRKSSRHWTRQRLFFAGMAAPAAIQT